MSITRLHFNKVACDYNNASKQFPWVISRTIEAYFVKKALKKCDLTDVLEMGCGSGFYSNILIENGTKNLTVIDSAEKMLEQISNPSIEKCHDDFESFFTDSKFTTIVCIGSLEFCENPDFIIQKYLKFLKNGGSFVFMVPKKSILSRLYKLHHKSINLPIKLFSMQFIKNAISSNHKIVSIRSVPPFSYIYRVISL